MLRSNVVSCVMDMIGFGSLGFGVGKLLLYFVFELDGNRKKHSN